MRRAKNKAAPPAPARPTTGQRRWLRWALVVIVIGGPVAVWLWWPPTPTPIPPVQTAGLDEEVVEAITKARSAAQAAPLSAKAWGQLGLVLFAQDLYADSRAILAEAERLDPREPRWPYFRGLALVVDYPEQGLAALEKAAVLEPRPFALRLRLAEQYLKLERFDQADAVLRALAAEAPEDARVLLGQGQVLVHRRQWREAVALLQKAAEHPTAQRAARLALADAYEGLNDPTAAEAERRRAAAAHDVPWPDPILAEVGGLRAGLQPRIEQALALMAAGQAQQASLVITGVLHDHPDSAQAHLALGKILIQAGKDAEAGKPLRRAIQLDPDLAHAHYLLAETLRKQNDFQGAMRSYQRTLELQPAEALAHYYLGICALKLGRRTAALEAFRNTLRYRPDLADAHVELGTLLLEDGKIDEAITHLDHAVRLEPTNERARTLQQQARAKKR